MGGADGSGESGGESRGLSLSVERRNENNYEEGIFQRLKKKPKPRWLDERGEGGKRLGMVPQVGRNQRRKGGETAEGEREAERGERRRRRRRRREEKKKRKVRWAKTLSVCVRCVCVCVYVCVWSSKKKKGDRYVSRRICLSSSSNRAFPLDEPYLDMEFASPGLD